MSEIGYNGRSLRIVRNGLVIAQVQTKSVPHTREPVEVTTDDDDGWRRLLPYPGRRAVDINCDGVASENNYALLRDEWLGNVMSDVEIHHADGAVESCEDGFFLSSLEFSGEEEGHVAFSAAWQSSGPVAIAAAS